MYSLSEIKNFELKFRDSKNIEHTFYQHPFLRSVKNLANKIRYNYFIKETFSPLYHITFTYNNESIKNAIFSSDIRKFKNRMMVMSKRKKEFRYINHQDIWRSELGAKNQRLHGHMLSDHKIRDAYCILPGSDLYKLYNIDSQGVNEFEKGVRKYISKTYTNVWGLGYVIITKITQTTQSIMNYIAKYVSKSTKKNKSALFENTQFLKRPRGQMFNCSRRISIIPKTHFMKYDKEKKKWELVEKRNEKYEFISCKKRWHDFNVAFEPNISEIINLEYVKQVHSEIKYLNILGYGKSEYIKNKKFLEKLNYSRFKLEKYKRKYRVKLLYSYKKFEKCLISIKRKTSLQDALNNYKEREKKLIAIAYNY